jgi:hypothetical protein
MGACHLTDTWIVLTYTHDTTTILDDMYIMASLSHAQRLKKIKTLGAQEVFVSIHHPHHRHPRNLASTVGATAWMWCAWILLSPARRASSRLASAKALMNRIVSRANCQPASQRPTRTKKKEEKEGKKKKEGKKEEKRRKKRKEKERGSET